MPPYAGPKLACLGTVDSTSLELRRRLEGPEGGALPTGYTVLAHEQTHGRGRFNRVWRCHPGDGLMASFWLHLDMPVADVAGFSLLPTLAVLDILHEVLGTSGLSLETPDRPSKKMTGKQLGCKWPNDIRVEGRKLCGILTECLSNSHGHIRGAMVGVGLNLRNAPPPLPPTSEPPPQTPSVAGSGVGPMPRPLALAELLDDVANELPNPEQLALRLGSALVRRTEQWRAGQRPALLREWLCNCDHQNARLLVTINGQKRWCRMCGLGLQGQLLVQLDGKLQEIWANDIEE